MRGIKGAGQPAHRESGSSTERLDPARLAPDADDPGELHRKNGIREASQGSSYAVALMPPAVRAACAAAKRAIGTRYGEHET